MTDYEDMAKRVENENNSDAVTINLIRMFGKSFSHGEIDTDVALSLVPKSVIMTGLHIGPEWCDADIQIDVNEFIQGSSTTPARAIIAALIRLEGAKQ